MNDFERFFQPLSQRIEKAQEHMKFHGGQDKGLWPFQVFALSVGELLDAAQSAPFFNDTKNNLKAAYEHVLRYEQQHEALWPYQSFSMTVDELLEAAISHFDTNFVYTARTKIQNQKEQYNKLRQDFDSYQLKDKSYFRA